jgi:hypothetical protein
VLLGEWFSSAHMACADAIRMGQAYRDDGGAVIWKGSARLESATSEPVGSPAG